MGDESLRTTRRRIPRATGRLLAPLLVVASLALTVGVAQAVVRPLGFTASTPPSWGPWSCTVGPFFESVQNKVAVSSFPTGWRTVGSGPDALNALAYSPLT